MTQLIVLAAIALLVPFTASAQSPSGPLVVEQIDNPFVVAPDYRIADVDGATGQLAGAYAGRLIENAFFVGGGAYWLVNGGRGEDMRYGGLLLGWSMPVGSRLRVGTRGLVGIGTATLGSDVTVRGGVTRTRGGVRAVPDRTVRFLARDDFFVFEPQVHAAVQLIPHLGVEVGGGYRLSGAADALEDRLNGVSGNVAVTLTF
jgi:hypothetical protein